MPLSLLPLAAALLAAAAPGDASRAPALGAATAAAGGFATGAHTDGPGTAGAEVGAAEAAKRPEGAPSWFALPMVFWLPETKLGFAGTAGLHFHVARGAGDSNAFLVAGYSVKGQGTVDLATDLALKGGLLVSTRLRAAYYPDVFYGIGPSTPVTAREDLTRSFAEAIVTAEVPFLKRFRAGPRLHARAEKVGDVQPGGLLAPGTLPGSEGFTALGLGLEATWDSRDREFWPTRGAFAKAWYVRYPSSLGRNDGFGRGSAEARYFLPLGRGRTLGLAGLVEHADGATPFSMMPKLGSTRYLRGIRDGRYRDQIAWAAQAEVRVPLAWRLAAALFGAFGDVGPRFAALRADTVKVAGGGGLRFRLSNQGANLRVDLAASGEGTVEAYVLLLEAF